jgi:hypothetical protein
MMSEMDEGDGLDSICTFELEIKYPFTLDDDGYVAFKMIFEPFGRCNGSMSDIWMVVVWAIRACDRALPSNTYVSADAAPTMQGATMQAMTNIESMARATCFEIGNDGTALPSRAIP